MSIDNIKPKQERRPTMDDETDLADELQREIITEAMNLVRSKDGDIMIPWQCTLDDLLKSARKYMELKEINNA